MNSKPSVSRKVILWALTALFVISGVIALGFSFSSGRNKDANDAISDMEIIYTNAMLTLDAQQLTLQAGAANASLTPAVLMSPAATLTPTSGLITLPTSTGAVAAPTCDTSVYLADVTIADGTTVIAGQTFTKTWKVSNMGTCTWSAAYQIILISGDGMSGKATPIGKIVKPGETVEVSVTLTAPSTTGTFKGTWRLSNDKSQPFGTLLTVEIKVGTVAYPNP